MSHTWYMWSVCFHAEQRTVTPWELTTPQLNRREERSHPVTANQPNSTSCGWSCQTGKSFFVNHHTMDPTVPELFTCFTMLLPVKLTRLLVCILSSPSACLCSQSITSRMSWSPKLGVGSLSSRDDYPCADALWLRQGWSLSTMEREIFVNV